jgi:hypothetical protein
VWDVGAWRCVGFGIQGSECRVWGLEVWKVRRCENFEGCSIEREIWQQKSLREKTKMLRTANDEMCVWCAPPHIAMVLFISLWVEIIVIQRERAAKRHAYLQHALGDE